MLWLLLIALLILVAVGALAFFVSRRSLTTDADEHKEIPSDCCGAHEVCERDSLLSKTNQIIYFDDEELDTLSGKDAATYTIEEQKQLEEVFLTLRESDVAGWLRSLQLRNIALPDELKEQALLIVRERRHLI
ncbi:MAG: phospholipase [Paludibacteraceae bacterium]